MTGEQDTGNPARLPRDRYRSQLKPAKGEQDTGNPARLPLAERARLGLLADEPELWLWEILKLEFPAQRQHPDRVSWENSVIAAAEFGMLKGARFEKPPGEPVKPQRKEDSYSGDWDSWEERRKTRPPVFITLPIWRIPRDAYRTWRATQTDTPAGSFIQLWLGAPTLPQGEPAPVPQGEPDKPEQVKKPRLSDKEILALRKQGLSNDSIHHQYGVPRDRITRVNKKYEVPQLNPGPKPKVPY